jgi:CHAT domain-containing protein/uncharacterized protein HemY
MKAFTVVLCIGIASAQPVVLPGEKARTLGRYTEALAQARSALNGSSVDSSARPQFELAVAATEVDRANFTEGRKILERLAAQSLPAPLAREVRRWLAECLLWQGDFAAAAKSFEPLLVWARQHGREAGAADILRQAGRLAVWRLEWAQARRLLNQAIGSAKATGDAATESLSRVDLALLDRDQGQERQASAELQSIAADPSPSTAMGAIFALEEAAGLAIRRGEFASAHEFGQRGLELARQVGAQAAEAGLLLFLASIAHDSGSLGESLVLVNQALPLARLAGDLKVEASCVRWQGSIESYRGAIDAAQRDYRAALEIQVQAGHLTGAAETEADLAYLDRSEGGLARAVAAAQHLAEVHKSLGQDHDFAVAQAAIAWRLMEQGRHPEALVQAEQSVAYLASHGDGYGAARSLVAAAEARRAVHGSGRAIADLTRARQFFQQTGDENNLADVLYRRATVEHNADQFLAAEADYKEASQRYTQIGNVPGLANSFDALGNLCYGNNQYSQAAEYYRKAIAVREKHGSPDPVLLTNLADSLRLAGNYDAGRKEYQRSLSLSISIKNHDSQAISLIGLGNVAKDQQQWDEALARYREALEVRKSQGKPADVATVMRLIGYLYQMRLDYPAALQWFEQTAPFCSASGQRLCEALGLEGQGVAYQSFGLYPQAEGAYQKALDILSVLDFPAEHGSVANRLANCYESQERGPVAIQLFEDDLPWVKTHASPALYAQRLLDLAKALIGFRGDSAEARRRAIESLHIRERLGAPKLVAAALDTLGDIEYDAGNTAVALRYYRQELEFDKRAQDEAGQASTFREIGRALTKLEKYDDAIQQHQRSLEIGQRMKLENEQARSHERLAETYRIEGEYGHALREANAAMPLARTRETTIAVLIELAQDQQAANLFGPALRNYNKALELSGQAGDKVNLATVHNYRASLYRALNQFREAKTDLIKDLDLSPKNADLTGLAQTYNDLAEVYRDWERYPEALDNHKKALDIVRNQARSPSLAATYLESRAATYQESGEPGKALLDVEEGLRLAESPLSNAARSSLLERKGRILEDYPKLGDAAPEYQLALDLAVAKDDKARIYGDLGDVALARKSFSAAQSWYEKQRDLADDMPDFDLEADAEYGLGEVSEGMHLPEAALSHFLKSIDLRESLEADAEQEDFRVSVAANMVNAVQRAFDLLVEKGAYRLAFELSERVRARSLVDQVAGARLGYSVTAVAETPEIAAIRGKLNTVEQQLEATKDKTGLEELYQARSQLAAAYEAAFRATDAPGAGKPNVVVTRPLAALQARIPRDQNLLAYFFGKRNAVVFQIGHNSFEGIRLKDDPRTIREVVKTAVQWGHKFEEEKRSQLQKLYWMLIGQVRGSLDGKTLGIVPNGLLNRVPFAALWDGKHYLSERFALFEIPSANFVAISRPAHGNAGVVVALSQEHPSDKQEDPSDKYSRLQQADREAREVAGLFRGSVAVPDAGAHDLLELGKTAYILHVAAHAENPANPWESAILLRQRVQIIDLQELIAPRLEMVVLSACETQGNQVSATDEAVSLQRAFLAAGAHTVIASLWKVDDGTTRELMLAFYRYLRSGKSRAEALALAQTDVRSRHPQPIDWAAFVVNGDPETLLLPPASFPGPLFWMAGLIAACVVAALWMLHGRLFDRLGEPHFRRIPPAGRAK